MNVENVRSRYLLNCYERLRTQDGARERKSILFLSRLQLSKGIADDEDLKRGLSLIKIFVIDREKIIVTVNENLHYY